MDTTKITYWFFTGLLTALSLFGSFLDLTYAKDAVELIQHLGYPLYFIPFIGVVRLLGIIAILIPGYPKIKEWAYAGLVFDFVGAIYSSIAVGDPFATYAPAVVSLIAALGSYVYSNKAIGKLFKEKKI